MRTRQLAHHLLSLLVSISLVLPPSVTQAVSLRSQNPLPASPTVGEEQMAASDSVRATAPQRPGPTGDLALYRTHITVDSPARRARLDALGIVVLEESEAAAVVLADDEQLETLARLRYQPQASDEFVSLVEASAGENSWLAAGLAPLVTQADSLRGQNPLPASPAAGEERMSARKSLRATAHALTPEQRTALADLTSLDDDADGLTNAQEAWWCTDPLNADTDGDGTSDGAEVAAAKDWLGNRRAGPPTSGRPFAGWPPSTFDTTRPPTCRDGDDDGVPDMAERWELGLNMNAESTDRDKFDDGQELFGTTEWGRGALPRVQDDAGYIFAEMPTWVKAPGNHPFVAAFPVPEIDVVASSLKVETVTTVTTDHVISSGTEKSYSTAKTEGTSDSVANTQSWNEWEESYTTSGSIEPGRLSRSTDAPIIPPGTTQCPPVQGPPLYMAAGALCTATVFAVNFCADNSGSYANGKCVKGAKWLGGQAKSAYNAAESGLKTAKSWLSDAVQTVKSKAVDTAGKTKDWIDTLVLRKIGCVESVSAK